MNLTQAILYFDLETRVTINSSQCLYIHCVFGQTADHEREFAMAAASVGDSLGIALSTAASFPLHHYFCSL